MAKITVNNEATRRYDRGVRLNNGTLVIHRNRLGEVIGTYLVTSFRNNFLSSNPEWRNTTSYCSLVNLETGYLAFEEPCSRSTTELRVLRHICRCKDKHGANCDDSKIAGSYISEYVDFEIHLKTE